MDEKGKNLATKEDIEEITRKTEEVQQEFREGFELFSNDVKFKYALNKIMEKMGLLIHYGNGWGTTDAGAKFSMWHKGVLNSDSWHPKRVVKDFLIKFTKKPQKKCQKQILAPDTFADGLFAPA